MNQVLERSGSATLGGPAGVDSPGVLTLCVLVLNEKDIERVVVERLIGQAPVSDSDLPAPR